jgi:hypothetical protein
MRVMITLFIYKHENWKLSGEETVLYDSMWCFSGYNFLSMLMVVLVGSIPSHIQICPCD